MDDNVLGATTKLCGGTKSSTNKSSSSSVSVFDLVSYDESESRDDDEEEDDPEFIQIWKPKEIKKHKKQNKETKH